MIKHFHFNKLSSGKKNNVPSPAKGVIQIKNQHRNSQKVVQDMCLSILWGLVHLYLSMADILKEELCHFVYQQ